MDTFGNNDQQPEGAMGNGRFFDDVAKDWILRDDLNAPTPQKPSAAARDTAGVHAQDPCVGLPRTGDGTYGTGHLHSQQQRARWKQEQHVAHGGQGLFLHRAAPLAMNKQVLSATPEESAGQSQAFSFVDSVPTSMPTGLQQQQQPHMPGPYHPYTADVPDSTVLVPPQQQQQQQQQPQQPMQQQQQRKQPQQRFFLDSRPTEEQRQLPPCWEEDPRDLQVFETPPGGPERSQGNLAAQLEDQDQPSFGIGLPHSFTASQQQQVRQQQGLHSMPPAQPAGQMPTSQAWHPFLHSNPVPGTGAPDDSTAEQGADGGR